MKNEKQMREVLRNEVSRWTSKPSDQLIAELKSEENYCVQFDGAEYQVEVMLLENTDDYVHVMIGVDDGHFPTAYRPLSDTFISRKPGR
jgi:hypothetical protein